MTKKFAAKKSILVAFHHLELSTYVRVCMGLKFVSEKKVKKRKTETILQIYYTLKYLV